MNLTRLWAKNCRTWKEVDLALAEGVTAVVGENGAGKSTLVNIADFALFGGRDLARLVTRGAGEEQGEVGCEFEHGAERYRVTRRFGAKPSLDLQAAHRADQAGRQDSLDIWGDWIPLTRETMAATQADLEALLGLDRQSFRASAFLAQGDGAAFTEAPPRERKEILSRVLGLGQWEQLRERAAADRTSAERDLSKLLGAIEQAEGTLELKPDAERRLAEARQKADQAKLARDDLERGLASVVSELEEAQRLHVSRDSVAEQHRAAAELARVRSLQAAEAKEAAAHAAQAADELKASPELADAERLEDEAREALSEAEQAREKKAAAEKLAALAMQALDEARARLQQLNQAAADEAVELASLKSAAAPTCPTCGQRLAGASPARVVAELQAHLDGLEERRSRAAEAVAEAEKKADAEALALERLERSKLPGAEEAREAYAVARRRTTRAQDLRRSAERLPASRARAADAERESEEAAERAEQLGRRLEALGSPPDLDALQERRSAATGKLSGLVQGASLLEQQAAKEEARLEQYDQLEASLGEQKAKLAETTRVVRCFKRLEEACGRDGVPALILDAVALPFLEAEASRIISELGRSFRVELRSQRATKGGDVREALDIVIMTPEGEADYADFSGGEQTRLNIALRVALARLLANRRGADVRLLVIDEPSHLDEPGFARLAEVLRGLEEFDRILVVSHVSALRDAFDSVVSVEGGGDSGEPSRVAS